MKLLYSPDKMLEMPSEPILEINNEIRHIAKEMIKICSQHKGIGLAGAQVGILKSLFVMLLPGPRNTTEEHVIINPSILWRSPEIEVKEEGCLSFPGRFEKVERNKIVQVQYTKLNGKINKATFDGLASRCFQHEYDHLSGIMKINQAIRGI